MLVSQHDHHRQSLVITYLHANPSVRFMSPRIRHSLENPTAGIGRRINSCVLRLASWRYPALRNTACNGKKTFHYDAGT
jgi:hypothetical protein